MPAEHGDSAIPAQSKAATAKAVQVRFNNHPHLWTVLNEVSKKHNLSKEEVLRGLLTFVELLAKDDRHHEIKRILKSSSSDTAAPVAIHDIVAMLLWGEHASSRALSWTLEEVSKSSQHALSMETHSLRSFGLFKQSHGWIDLAHRLRNKALRVTGAEQDKHFEAALKSLLRADLLNVALLGMEHRVMHYNRACVHSTIAQYIVEYAAAKLGRAAALQVAANDFRAGSLTSDDFEAAVETFWFTYANEWRKEPFFAMVEPVVTAHAELAQSQLSQTTLKPFPTLGGFIYDKANHDHDLLFLRLDHDYSVGFKRWKTTGEDLNENKLYDAFDTLIKLPNGLNEQEVKVADPKLDARLAKVIGEIQTTLKVTVTHGKQPQNL